MEWLIDIWEGTNSIFSGFSLDGGEAVVTKMEEARRQLESADDLIKSSIKEAKPDKENGFLGVAYFDDDLWKMLLRFAINMLFVGFIVRALYYPSTKRKDYLFTYLMISVITFFICFALKKFDLGTGMALALFAIFGIIRYRTDPIPIKEMTYLFVVIGVSVINALANKKMSYAEQLFANTMIVAIIYGLEKIWLLKHEEFKSIVYEKIDLIKAQNYEALKADLEERTGLKINRVEVGKIDFLRDTANLKIYYFVDEQDSPQFEEA